MAFNSNNNAQRITWLDTKFKQKDKKQHFWLCAVITLERWL